MTSSSELVMTGPMMMELVLQELMLLEEVKAIELVHLMKVMT